MILHTKTMDLFETSQLSIDSLTFPKLQELRAKTNSEIQQLEDKALQAAQSQKYDLHRLFLKKLIDVEKERSLVDEALKTRIGLEGYSDAYKEDRDYSEVCSNTGLGSWVTTVIVCVVRCLL